MESHFLKSMPRLGKTLIAAIGLSSLCCSISYAKDSGTAQNWLPVSAPITTEFAGQQGAVASQSVVRVICKKSGMGTGFLHRSGKIITAAHVVSGCQASDILVITSSGKALKANSVTTDSRLDLALIGTTQKIDAVSLPISRKTEIHVGTPVTTWGFPGGYNGFTPLLTVGYLAGVDAVPAQGGGVLARWVVNAAFNSGNSGGPVLSPEDGEVIGVVDSKLAPISPDIESALYALANQRSGFVYTERMPDGKIKTLSEGQVIEGVLMYLRGQTQLVLGQAVTSGDLLIFLKKEGDE